MTSRDFCYWLQGLLEVGEITSLNANQVELIKKHLNMVFIHEIDPAFPPEQQESLNQAHSGKAGSSAWSVQDTGGGWGSNEDTGFNYPPGARC